MTDSHSIHNRSRVQAGVPTGGEFATEARSENDDLPVGITQEQMDDHQLRREGITEVRLLPGIDPYWAEENRGVSATLRNAGVTGRMTVFQYSREPIGEWSGAVAMPDGDFLVFTKSVGGKLSIETRQHPSDGPYVSGAYGVEGEEANFGETVERVLFEHELLSQLRREMPYTDLTCLGGRNGGTVLRIRGLESLGTNREIVNFKPVGKWPNAHWVPAKGSSDVDGFAADHWAKAARLTHMPEDKLGDKLQGAAYLAVASGNVFWNTEARMKAIPGEGI